MFSVTSTKEILIGKQKIHGQDRGRDSTGFRVRFYISSSIYTGGMPSAGIVLGLALNNWLDSSSSRHNKNRIRLIRRHVPL